MVLVELSLYESYGRHKVLQNVGALGVVYIDLVPYECLARQLSAHALRPGTLCDIPHGCERDPASQLTHCGCCVP